ncbi:PREDICTED: protein IQ-DOMAIN 1 [Populus euphratica]|uniref:Protein IQ-DOMAIN 1 n=1 Tax=Populus euphratica TaxID=75702 RepID=A0AAJ6UCI4_POPEU|nr:PREDICTED: protein IQ-DOMAIN 1 [Populus euphratica]XP_011026999.1 PREDICTED: protein IQ-DOMAIN 1 [Populus euphratica]
MGRRGSWFSALKKALGSSKKSKSKKKWSEKEKNRDLAVSSHEETVAPSLSPPRTPPPPTAADVKLTEAENEQSKHAYSVALATAVAAEAAVAAAQAAAEVVRLTTVANYSGKSKEEIAAIRIQTAFRGYLARRALRALRGLVRLKSLIQGQSVKRQATATLRAMQTLARVQSQIRARRIRMSEENEALQRQLQQKHDKELDKLRTSIGEQWDDSPQSKEEVEASLLHKQEAAMRRERALAYAYSHQQMWKQSSKSANATFMDPNNPRWGWSWLERWMAARPWESRSIIDNNDRASVKSTTSRTMSLGEISRAYSRRDLNHDNKPSPGAQKSSRPPSRQSPSTPPSKAPSTSSVTGKAKPPSPRGSAWGGDEDSRSTFSVQSERYRRHSIAGSSIRDDESLASSPSVPSYMAPTRSQSAKAKSRLSSPSGMDNNGTPDKASMGYVKKRLSFSASPAGARRHSGPPRVDASAVKDIQMHTEEKMSNGASSK